MVYAALLRGINVGGNNKVSMAGLKTYFESLGYDNVKTYINSGNVLFASDRTAEIAAKQIEKGLQKTFELKEPIKVLVISHDQLKAIIVQAPKGFGQEPAVYHSDVLFLMGATSANAMGQLEMHPEVDIAWPGDGIVYYQRLSAKRTKSRLSKIVSKPIYKSITIRSWSTVCKLAGLMGELSPTATTSNK